MKRYENIKKFRLEIGLTQERVAEILRMPKSTYASKENGQRRFSVEEAIELSEVLKKEIRDIFL